MIELHEEKYMEITTQGTAEGFFAPEQISINLTFTVKEQEYDKVLKEGTKSVVSFMDEVLTKMGLKKEDMKTRNFKVVEKTKQVKKKEKNQYGQYDFERVPDGLEFTQNATIKFDYDTTKMTNFVAMVSKLVKPPVYTITFELKNSDEYKNKILAQAFQIAETKAKSIATAAKFKSVECLKTSFMPFEENVSSKSQLANQEFMLCRDTCDIDVAENIGKTFTPEDVYISETLYCLFVAK